MRRLAILAAIVAVFLPLLPQSAGAAEPVWVGAESYYPIYDGCFRSDIYFGLEPHGTGVPMDGAHASVVVERWDTCTGKRIDYVQGGDWVSLEDGLDLYTKGLSVNTHFRADHYSDTHVVQYDKYEMWLSLQIKCTEVTDRYHPGVRCFGTLSGQISFGQRVFKAPAGTFAVMAWLLGSDSQ
ncbi:MAG: hypothetical protein QOF01_3551 [Thermomicrobiales bacterium]|nr:hypothetical protein [Thermomicrobiales bacterium]